MIIKINIEKDIAGIAFGIGYNLEKNSLGLVFLYWSLEVNFKKNKSNEGN